VDQELADLFAKMNDNSFELGEITKEIIEGLVTRKGDNMFTSNKDDKSAKKLVRGKNIDRYELTWPTDQYIKYEPEHLHRARPLWVHEAPLKLITQRIGGGAYPLRVALDEDKHYIFASTNAILFKDDIKYEEIKYNPRYILAVLNSKLLNAYYLMNFSNRSSFTVNISKTFLGSLPIKITSEKQQQLIVFLVNLIIYLHENHPKEDEIIEFFDKKILDSLIFELYFRNQDDLKLFEAFSNLIQKNYMNDEGFNRIINTFDILRTSKDLIKLVNKTNEMKNLKLINKLFEKRT